MWMELKRATPRRRKAQGNARGVKSSKQDTIIYFRYSLLVTRYQDYLLINFSYLFNS